MRYEMNAHEIEAYILENLQKNMSISFSYQTTSVALKEQGREKARKLMHKYGIDIEVEAERASVPQLQRFPKKYIAFCNVFEMDPGLWPVHRYSN